MAEEKPKCDIDDLMCQMQALNYLDGLKNLLGTEKFQERYPEFKGLDEVVKGRMGEQRGTIKEMMERCGLGHSLAEATFHSNALYLGLLPGKRIGTRQSGNVEAVVAAGRVSSIPSLIGLWSALWGGVAST
ncbi:unnamed protein product [marine sediment metagenome]|uniref:Uncharacterized protein n=1 Tax=marine sediment metagenome TaxID=412755 RepID=X1M9G5_9ZZZZ